MTATEKIRMLVKAHLLHDLAFQLEVEALEENYDRAQGVMEEIVAVIPVLEQTLDNLQHGIP